MVGIPNFVFADGPDGPPVDYFSDPNFHIYKLQEKQFEYLIPYSISGGEIQKIDLDCSQASMMVYLQNAGNGTLAIVIPRTLLDSKLEGKDEYIFALVDGQEVDYKETKSSDSRALEISFPSNTQKIEILVSIVSGLGGPPFPKIDCGVAGNEESIYYHLISPAKHKSSLDDYLSESFQIYKIKEQRHQFFIPYLITNSKLIDMSVDCPSRALIIDIEPKNQDSSLIIALPRGLLDSTYGDEDDSFFIIVDGEEVDSSELDTNQDVRVIQIQIAKNSSRIEIISAFLVSQSDNPMKISPCGTGRAEQSPFYQLLSPLQQEKAGYQPDEVICKQGLELAIKSQRAHHSPLCLKHDTLPILIQRGFALEIVYAN